MIKSLIVSIAAIAIISTNSFGQTAEDSLQIKKVALDYIEGYYTKNAERMKSALHPELAKRSIYKDDQGNAYLLNLSASHLVNITRHNENKNLENPDKGLESEVIILDIFNNAASVKLTNNQYRFIDYMHLGKIEGEWKIVNVLWEEF